MKNVNTARREIVFRDDDARRVAPLLVVGLSLLRGDPGGRRNGCANIDAKKSFIGRHERRLARNHREPRDPWDLGGFCPSNDGDNADRRLYLPFPRVSQGDAGCRNRARRPGRRRLAVKRENVQLA